jgi:hypothetical protein
VDSFDLNSLGRPEKILVAMGELSEFTTKALDYEDIVVKSWELFPTDFGLRKYAEKYPDSSDIHKPLYGPLKTKGLILSGSKKFKLTEKALAYLEDLQRHADPKKKSQGKKNESYRLDRASEQELKRISGCEAFTLFTMGQKNEILDTDFHEFFGTSPRMNHKEFQGRLSTVKSLCDQIKRLKNKSEFTIINQLHAFLIKKFGEIVDRRVNERP